MISHGIPDVQKGPKAFAMVLAAALILTACSPSRANEPGPATQPVQPPASPGLTSTDTQPPEASGNPTPALVSTPPPAVESSVTACSLVTPEEASAAVGNSVGDPVEEDYVPLFGCRYEASALEFVSISLVIFDNATQAAEAFQSMLDLNQYEQVSGIGDRALKPAILDIDVLKGKYDLSIGVVNSGDREARFEQAKKLAELALGRLP